MLKMIRDLFYMPRSIMGEPSRQTLIYIKKLVEEIKIIKFKSGTKAFDWTVPNEWSIKDAFIKDMAGKKVLDFKKNLLSVVYYSMPINKLAEAARDSAPDKERMRWKTLEKNRTTFCMTPK